MSPVKRHTNETQPHILYLRGVIYDLRKPLGVALEQQPLHFKQQKPEKCLGTWLSKHNIELHL